MKITFITPIYPDKGISIYSDHLIKALQNKIDNINVVSFKHLYPKFFYPVKGGENNHSLNYKKNVIINRVITWYNPLTWLKATFLCKTKIVHYQWWANVLSPIYFTLLVLNKIQNKINIITVHNVLSHDSKITSHLINKVLFPFCNYFIVHNNKNKKQLSTIYNINENKISVVPIGKYNNLYKKYNKQDAKKMLFLDNKKKYILFAGHIRKYKGIDLLLKAFVEIAKRNNNINLIIAGYPWINWNKYDKFINKNKIKKKIIIILEYLETDKLNKLFSAADLVVMPYHNFDGSSGLLKTAMFFKKPVIASDIDDFKEVINKKYLFKDNNKNSLVKKILEIINFKNKNDIFYKEIDSWENISKKYFEIYKYLLNK